MNSLNRILIEKYSCNELTGTELERVKELIHNSQEAQEYLKNLELSKNSFLLKHPFRITEWERYCKPSFSTTCKNFILFGMDNSFAIVVSFVLIFSLVIINPLHWTNENRLKSAEALDYVVMRNGTLLNPGEVKILRPGDRVQFSYSNVKWSRIQFLSIDNMGRISFYSPINDLQIGSESSKFGNAIPLPYSIILDTLGTEDLFVLVKTNNPLPKVIFENAARENQANYIAIVKAIQKELKKYSGEIVVAHFVKEVK